MSGKDIISNTIGLTTQVKGTIINIKANNNPEYIQNIVSTN